MTEKLKTAEKKWEQIKVCMS